MTGFLESMGMSSIPVVAAFFIGLMTAFSPCPLATNIAAIAYISGKGEKFVRTLSAGILYAGGRAFGYILVAAAVLWLGLGVAPVSAFLRNYGEMLLGPFLLIIGIIILKEISFDSFNFLRSDYSGRLKMWLFNQGLLGSFGLGFVFALAFCPFSAALFFGMLIPIAVSNSDPLIIPASFALATAFPVILVSLLIGGGITGAARFMGRVNKADSYIRTAAAYVFIAGGIYYIVIWIKSMIL
ncbi:aromatic aminobenezylarsenical efflux permease ArsG family transporter [Methanoplanus limicola]|uniref:Putative cytochrome c biogenesis protein n=1 Tax=Methanoplanus limicola DSM 2279 TaxID=937775 RepID=H1Z201_9EURY|nr:aromatic aminobenezylarsenical efflux permease ArsG family transporter [Methanoplanus limicola]EHQ36346.1 putative cytochrome c biogenesis protein [Methanoplanus limicola DSM 2279]